MKGKHTIPPGAPGHPREENEEREGFASPRRGPGDRAGDGPRAERRPEHRAASARRAELVFEGEGILAFDKPEGLPVIAPEGSRSRCLLDIATEQVRRHNPKGRAAVVHRIDRDTSGIVIFAEDGAMKRELMGAWDDIVKERLYVALVEGELPSDRGVFDSFLRENKAGTVYSTAKDERGSKRAITRWRVLRRGEGLCLLELSLETGRKHQIRVQLADSGHPVLGDPRYGSVRGTAGDNRTRRPRPDRLCLHALAIELELPGRDRLRIESRIPPEFEAALSARPSSSSVSRSEARSGARPGRGAPRGKG